MPAHHKKTPGAGGILLLEEYPPLASAFGSAIRKFAGERETKVVSSMAEATHALEASRLDLLVLDFDPPLRGSVDFFHILHSFSPETRVLILVPAQAPNFSEHRFVAALHFIEKPFELSNFGAEIARLLQANEPAGRIRDLGLVDLITLYAISAANMVLKVEAGTRHGEIHFYDGRITHASAMGRAGVEALHAIMRWRSPRFVEAERPSDAAHTIQVPWVPLIMEGLHAARPSAFLKTREAVNPLPPIRRQKIVVIEDTELISVFVEEVLSSSAGSFEIALALNGAEGLSRVAQIKPDLVLLDYNLPDVKGDEVARRLIENPETAGVPVIMMSGNVTEMASTAERFSNVVATIAKPFLSEELIELVTRTLADPPQRILKKAAPKASAIEPHVAEAKKAKNGRRVAAKSKVIPEKTGEASTILPEKPEPEEAKIERKNAEAELASEALSLPPEPPEEADEGTAETSISPLPNASGIPAAINQSTSNAVVLGLALEVISIEFSPTLRIEKIRARPFSPTVSLRVLRQTSPGSSINTTSFNLASVEVDKAAQINLVRLVPTRTAFPGQTRYPMAIDGVTISPARHGQAVQLLPTAVAPMRLQLLSLFELSSVELSPEFRVAQLLLKARGGKTRITLLPEVPHTGATFEIAEVRVDPRDAIGEILLEAAPP